MRDEGLQREIDVGFYGLDVYSLCDSLRITLGYLQEHRPDDLEAADAAAACFEPHGEDPQSYAASTRIVPEGCEDEVVALLTELQRSVDTFDGDQEAQLDALQRRALLPRDGRWRPALVERPRPPHGRHPRPPHRPPRCDLSHHRLERNTHVGDARATDMHHAGMVDVGQLVRERRQEEGVFLLGFGGHRGSVLAADRWGAPGHRLPVPPAPTDTHEDLLHAAVGAPAIMDLSEIPEPATGCSSLVATVRSASSTPPAIVSAIGCQPCSASATTRSSRSTTPRRCIRS